MVGSVLALLRVCATQDYRNSGGFFCIFLAQIHARNNGSQCRRSNWCTNTTHLFADLLLCAVYICIFFRNECTKLFRSDHICLLSLLLLLMCCTVLCAVCVLFGSCCVFGLDFGPGSVCGTNKRTANWICFAHTKQQKSKVQLIVHFLYVFFFSIILDDHQSTGLSDQYRFQVCGVKQHYHTHSVR